MVTHISIFHSLFFYLLFSFVPSLNGFLSLLLSFFNLSFVIFPVSFVFFPRLVNLTEWRWPKVVVEHDQKFFTPTNLNFWIWPKFTTPMNITLMTNLSTSKLWVSVIRTPTIVLTIYQPSSKDKFPTNESYQLPVSYLAYLGCYHLSFPVHIVISCRWCLLPFPVVALSHSLVLLRVHSQGIPSLPYTNFELCGWLEYGLLVSISVKFNY